MDDLDHAINIYNNILADHNYSEEKYRDIFDIIKLDLLNNHPNLYKHAQGKMFEILGCNKKVEISSRFHFIIQILDQFQKERGNTTNNKDNDIEKEAYSIIKHEITEKEFRGRLSSKIDSTGADSLSGYYSIITSFYQTPDSELPLLRGNLGSLFYLLGIDFYKAYEEARERVAAKAQTKFFDTIQEIEPAKKIWNSILEDAKKDTRMMDNLRNYFKQSWPSAQEKLNEFLS